MVRSCWLDVGLQWSGECDIGDSYELRNGSMLLGRCGLRAALGGGPRYGMVPYAYVSGEDSLQRKITCMCLIHIMCLFVSIYIVYR